MKATITILATLLTLQAGLLFADNKISSTPATNDNTTITQAFLAPATPVEAVFEEIATAEMNDLMPAAPSEATFEDMPVLMTSIRDLSPVTPAIADFENAVDMTIDIRFLAPVTPAVADFE